MQEQSVDHEDQNSSGLLQNLSQIDINDLQGETAPPLIRKEPDYSDPAVIGLNISEYLRDRYQKASKRNLLPKYVMFKRRQDKQVLQEDIKEALSKTEKLEKDIEEQQFKAELLQQKCCLPRAYSQLKKTQEELNQELGKDRFTTSVVNHQKRVLRGVMPQLEESHELMDKLLRHLDEEIQRENQLALELSSQIRQARKLLQQRSAQSKTDKAEGAAAKRLQAERYMRHKEEELQKLRMYNSRRQDA